jgi:hypothetical protein
MAIAMLTIKDICKRWELSPVYVRRAITNGTLPARKELVPGNQTTMRNVVTEEDALAWRAKSGHNKRDDGRNRFLLYATAEEAAQLGALVAEHPELAGISFARQNPSKAEVAE